MKKSWIYGFGLSVFVAFLMLAPTVMAAPQTDNVSNRIQRISDRISMDKTGSTELFGGGNYVGISSPDGDAWIAVVYGVEGRENSITIVSSYTRYLGGADIYDENGALIAKSRPIPVKTLYIQRFDSIYEYNDTNGDGVANAIRRYDSMMPADLIAHEPVYKSVSLKTAWDKSDVVKTEEDNTTMEWTFSLTAGDLPYNVIGNESKVNASVGDGKLNMVKFTFHLRVTRTEVNVSVPIYKVTVDIDKDNREVSVVSSEEGGTRPYNGTKLSADIKYDQEILGWDFDPSNDNPGLVLETHAFLGTGVGGLTWQWMNQQFIRERIRNGEGAVEFEDENGERNITTDEAPDDINVTDQPRVLKRNRLHFADNWERIGMLKWVSNATYYANDTAPGEDGQVKFMIYGARRFSNTYGGRMGGIAYRGVAIFGGFTYKGAYRIVHDPTYTCDVNAMNIQEQSILPSEEEESTGGGRAIPSFEAALVIPAAAVAIALVMRRKRI